MANGLNANGMSGTGPDGLRIANPNNGGNATLGPARGTELDISNPNFGGASLADQSEEGIYGSDDGLRIANPNNSRSGYNGKGI